MTTSKQQQQAAAHPKVSECVVVIDFGSQYSMLIARRVRESNVYCEVVPFDAPWERIAALNPRGFILSGGPASVYEKGAPRIPQQVLDKGYPVLGICYGMQALAHQLGGDVAPAGKREYGRADIAVKEQAHPLFIGLPEALPVWMSHGDHVTRLPAGFRALASTPTSPVAVMANDKGMIGIQFHPEVVHTPMGMEIIQNFLYRVCGLSASWTPAGFIEESILSIKAQVGDKGVVCALSGGVDSSVAATLIHQAIGRQLTCVFVDNGLLRKGEAEQVRDLFGRNMKMNLRYIDAKARFMAKLKGVTDPERKRKVIGEEFVRIFEEEGKGIGDVKFLAQGTTYPDVIESRGPENKASAVIKTHHNVGGLPERMDLALVEPMRYLFKDEVRRVGAALGLPDELVWRQPFPGPGLAVRILGEVTPEKVHTLQEADAIVREEIESAGLQRGIWQYFGVLTDARSVGVMGDFRTYGHVVAVRAVTSEDAMTADWARIPYEVLARMSNRIVNEVDGVNRVAYDITSKPPGTIEWE